MHTLSSTLEFRDLWWLGTNTKLNLLKTFQGVVLCPDPTLYERGSGEFGQNPWVSAEEFPRANQIAE